MDEEHYRPTLSERDTPINPAIYFEDAHLLGVEFESRKPERPVKENFLGFIYCMLISPSLELVKCSYERTIGRLRPDSTIESD